jgi:hypothetical protein
MELVAAPSAALHMMYDVAHDLKKSNVEFYGVLEGIYKHRAHIPRGF